MQVLLFANQSENKIIAKSAILLNQKNWPDYLIIYNNAYYLQNLEYRDEVPGIDWRVVVLIPCPAYTDHLNSSTVLYRVIVALGSFIILLAILGMLITIYFRNTKIFKLTRPILSLIVLTGILLLGIYCLFLVGENNASNCVIRPWLFNLAFTLAFSPLLIKAYKVHRVFNVKPMDKNKMVSNYTLLFYTSSLVLLDAALISVVTYGIGDGTRSRTRIEQINGAATEVTYCSTTRNSVFLFAELVFKGILVAIACGLAFIVRKIPGTIAGSKSLLIVVYNVAFFSGFTLLIIHNVTDVGLNLVIQAGAICICSIISAGLLVLPTWYRIITIGDEKAAEAVLDEVFTVNRASANNTNHQPSPRSNHSNHHGGSSFTFGRSPAKERNNNQLSNNLVSVNINNSNRASVRNSNPNMDPGPRRGSSSWLNRYTRLSLGRRNSHETGGVMRAIWPAGQPEQNH